MLPSCFHWVLMTWTFFKHLIKTKPWACAKDEYILEFNIKFPNFTVEHYMVIMI